MVLAVWQRTITDNAGNALPAASVEVRAETGGAPLAVLFSDRAGTVPLANPFLADANGFAQFFTAGGAFKITATLGSSTSTWRYVGIGTASEHDADSDLSTVNLAFGGTIDWNSGDISITQVSQTLAFAGASSGYTFDADITQSALGGFWKDVAPTVNIARFDRVFVGAGADVNGNFSGSQGGIIPTDTEGGKYLGGRDVQLLSIAKTGLVAISGVSRSSDQNAAPSESIGVAGFVINDKSGGLGWGSYFEVQHEASAGALAASYGIEIDLKNKTSSNISIDPYVSSGAGTFGLWIVAGGDTAYGGSPANPSTAAIAIRNNGHTWNSGIVFQQTSITGSNGVTGTGIAIDMAKGHTIRWLQTGGVLGAAIRSDVGTSGKDVQMLFSDDAVAWYGANNKEIFSINRPVASPVNNVRIYNAATGVAPTVAAIGDDTNVDLTLDAKGTGVIRSSKAVIAPVNMYAVASVNFNSANTDTSIPILLPSGYTRYRISQVIISGASGTLTTATFGLFTAAAAGGTAIIASGSAITVATASENTDTNMQIATPLLQNTRSLTTTPLFFRVQTAQGAARTATVTVIYTPVS